MARWRLTRREKPHHFLPIVKQNGAGNFFPTPYDKIALPLLAHVHRDALDGREQVADRTGFDRD